MSALGRLSPEQRALVVALQRDQSGRQPLLPGLGSLVRARGLGLWSVGDGVRRWTTSTVKALERRGVLRRCSRHTFELVAPENTNGLENRLKGDKGPSGVTFTETTA